MPRTIVASNRRARHDYHIEDSLEAGLVLHGTEVKALREGRASIGESYAGESDGELWLFNAYIPEYAPGGKVFQHEVRRPRKLLIKGRERDRLFAEIEKKGMTLVPLSLYFTPRGIAKAELGLARGKQAVDKRETEKKRDWQRQKQRLLRERG